ncbi:7TM diverse intracellular signaling domain-containing protein [Hydrogenophaga sp.]|uniref:sensor domain-containing diguanylate cyclase n=1 Tax=Hydrogenophaga sp. TaxID=1904254 RepID=UPI0027255F3B|nr:7TM diverse intracellular signaling domain-containing protein [Hydrogenophaga sp.]MDO9135603.1 7TM diverse intracellular signaling domain-containing protein [Hydrogenophaga sp.]
MTFLVRLCALCALLLSLHAAHAQPGPQPSPLSLDGTKSTLSLAGRSSFWVDGGGQLTVDQLEQLQAELPFSIRNRDNRLQLGPGAVLWVKFDARVVDTGTQWELELTHAGTDLVSLFHRQADGSWKAQHAGDRIAVRDWAYPDRYPVFALDPRADQTVTYWVRIEHARVPFSGELLVHNHNALRELRIQQQFLLGAYFGMALLLVATAVANALVFRDTSFAAYAVYVTVLALALSASLGVGGQFIWPGWPRWNGLAEFVLLPLTAVTGLLFVRHVVQPRRIGRGLDRLALTLAGVFLALTVWDVLHPTATSLQALTAIGALTMALVYAMLWAAWRTGDRWVRWIALGILPVLLAGTLPVLRNFGLLSSGSLSQYGMVLAAVIEAPLLIYGLLQRSSVQHEAQTRARALALTEPLTGLTNRHNFMLRLHESLVRAQRYQHHSALLLIDLDNHGWFAETHGREVADRALVLTGSLLRSVARDVDTAGRVNDSTLALLMEGPVREAQVVAAATSIVAGGLRPSSQLPVGATLKFKVVLALLPDAASGADLESNAQAHLDWLGSGLDALRQDGRRTILKLNF